MSAWIVEPEQIDLIITEAIKSEHISQTEDLNALGQMLLDENRASIDFRYEETNTYVAYTFKPFPLEYNRFDVDMAVRSYAYQSCEHRGWDTSEAYAWVKDFKRANKARFDDVDEQAMHDDDNRGWSVCIGGEWEEGVEIPDYRSAVEK